MVEVALDLNDQEVRKEATVNAISACDIADRPTDQLIAYFSNWRRLKRAVAWFLRLKARLLAQSRLRQQTEVPAAEPDNTRQGSLRQVERQRVTVESRVTC